MEDVASGKSQLLRFRQAVFGFKTCGFSMDVRRYPKVFNKLTANSRSWEIIVSDDTQNYFQIKIFPCKPHALSFVSVKTKRYFI